MGQSERQYRISSLLVNDKLLEEAIKIIDNNNPKDIKIKTEIIINSEQEKSSFENVKDLVESRILPKKIKSISIRKNSYPSYIKEEGKIIGVDKKKFIEFFLNIDEEPNSSYYQLIGYDDGKLSTCQKQLGSLFDEYKNWYAFLFKIPAPEGTIPLASSISFAILVWKFIPYLPSVFHQFRGFISFVAFGIFWYLFYKLYNFMFPFLDLQINKTKRSNLTRSIIGIVTLGLIVNLIWKIIELAFFSK